MRKLIFVILIICVHVTVGQLIVKPIQKPSSHKARNGSIKSTEPATLPFWDDFSISGNSPGEVRIWEGDTASQWNAEASKDVYVNATLAVNPPSYKVATFDGLDANGGFHGGDKGLADQLVSDTIDLQGKADVVLSFYWQAGGNVEIPDEGDSLVLQFYSPNIETNDGWKTVWSKDGGELNSNQDSVFTQVTRDVGSEFLTTKFVFRFQSYGDLDGPFDAWHVDYIYMDENRANDNFYYDDISLNSQPSALLAPFNSIPSNQLFNNISKFTGNVEITATALEKPDESNAGVPARYKLEIRELTTSSFIDSVDFGDQPTIPVNQNPFEVNSSLKVLTSNYDLSAVPTLDSMILESKVFISNNIDSLFGTLNIDQFNDTIHTQHLLHNYYAFDDGTAEYAVGTNISGGQVAVKFWLEEDDTLTHVDIHFPNIDPSSANSALSLQIFKSLNQEPIRTQPITVINATALNEFTRYELSRPLMLADTFYIGYQQSKNEYIGIGFDRSNPGATPYIFENKTGQWEQNDRLQGALMIRPVFAKIDSFVLSTNPKQLALKAYPNPTAGVVRIAGSYRSITLMDFSGRVLINEKAVDTHDFSNVRAGLYLLTIHRKEGDQTIKIIKE